MNFRLFSREFLSNCIMYNDDRSAHSERVRFRQTRYACFCLCHFMCFLPFLWSHHSTSTAPKCWCNIGCTAHLWPLTTLCEIYAIPPIPRTLFYEGTKNFAIETRNAEDAKKMWHFSREYNRAACLCSVPNSSAATATRAQSVKKPSIWKLFDFSTVDAEERKNRWLTDVKFMWCLRRVHCSLQENPLNCEIGIFSLF